MRDKIVAGNWKMNKTFEEAEDLIFDIMDLLEEEKLDKTKVMICPPSPYLELASDAANESELMVGAQNISEHESGAYTGEISAAMINSLEVAYCIIGHSERRKYFNETHEMLQKKLDLLLKYDIRPVFCIGELLEEREKDNHFDVVKKQLQDSAFHLDYKDFAKLVIAYEPVWAIGTGVNATPEQAQEMHHYIRNLVKERYGEGLSDNTSILYGGSCNSKNAASLFENPDVDGGLIGGASLKADEFMEIARQREKY